MRAKNDNNFYSTRVDRYFINIKVKEKERKRTRVYSRFFRKYKYRSENNVCTFKFEVHRRQINLTKSLYLKCDKVRTDSSP